MRLRDLICWPWRLWRERISVQLILSYVLVVIVTILLLQLTALGVLFGVLPDRLVGGSAMTLDYTLGEKTRSYAFWLGPDRLAGTFTEGITAEERNGLEQELRQITAGTVSGFERDDQRVASTAYMAPNRIAHAALISPFGTVIASSDEGWMRTNRSFTQVPFAPARRAIDQALDLDGGLSAFGSLYVLDGADSTTAAAYPLIASDGGIVAYLVTQGVPWNVSMDIGRLEVLQELLWANLDLFWIITIPAFLVSIPVGIWRARSVSRRLTRLADATDAMAQGGLNQPVRISRPDEIGRLGERFNEMSARLTQTDRDRRAFIANVSHELRTPVAIIKGHVERLLSPGGEGGEAALETIYQETVTMSHLIDDLFTLARLEETALPLEFGAVPVQEVAAQVVAGLREPTWRQRKVTIESVVPTDLPPALADRTRLRQILNNLLYNALRHTPEGGLVIVDAAAREGMIHVSVTDTGVGIAEAELNNVFDRFYRVERRQRHDEGSGLGLNIVKQLVEAQGGTVDVRSAPDEGTTFRFTLPLAPSLNGRRRSEARSHQRR